MFNTTKGKLIKELSAVKAAHLFYEILFYIRKENQGELI